MEEQRKFKILKNRLDSMNYKYPFTMESSTLIEALLNDVNSLNQSLQKLRIQKSDHEGIRELSERIEILNREKIRLEEELDRCNLSSKYEEKESLKLSMTELRRENKYLNQRIGELQSTKREIVENKSKEYIDKLFSDFNFLKKQLEDSEEYCQKLMFENRSLQDRLKVSENQINSLRKELDVSLFTIKDITNENRSTTEEYYSLKKIISSYESKFVVSENQIDDLRVENQKLQQFNRSLEQQVSNLSKECSKGRSELEMSSSSKIRLSSQADSLQRQVDILQNENNKLHSLRDDDRQSLIELEKKHKEIEESFKNAQDKIRVIQRESQGFCETIREKGEEIRAKEQIRRGMEKEIKDIKIFITKFEDSQIENKKLRDLNEELNIELKKLKQEVNETKGNLKYKEEDAKQFKKHLEQANKDLDILKQKIKEENEKNIGYNQCLRNNSQLEDQLKITNSKVEESINRERQLLNELEQVRVLLQNTDEKLSFSNKQNENIQNQRASLEQENNKLQKNLSEYIAKDNSKTLEIARYESRLEQSYLEMDEVKKQNIRFHDELLSLQEELRDCKKALNAEQSYTSRQNEQISQLRELISSLEIAKNDCTKKIENYQLIEIDKENSIKWLREENGQMKKQLSLSEKMNSELVEEKESLIKQTESLKYEIGRRNDEILTLKNSIKKYISDIEDIKFKAESINENFKKS